MSRSFRRGMQVEHSVAFMFAFLLARYRKKLDGTAKTRSQECERCTHECVRHGLAAIESTGCGWCRKLSDIELKPVPGVSTFSGVAGVGQTTGFCRLPSPKRSTMENTWAGRPHQTMVCPTSESQAKCREFMHRLKPVLPLMLASLIAVAAA